MNDRVKLLAYRIFDPAKVAVIPTKSDDLCRKSPRVLMSSTRSGCTAKASKIKTGLRPSARLGRITRKRRKAG